MTTKGPKKPAPSGGPLRAARASKPRPSKPKVSARPSSARPKRTLTRVVGLEQDDESELPKIFGGGPASRPKPAAEQEPAAAPGDPRVPASEPPVSYRAELISTARLEDVASEPPPANKRERPSKKSVSTTTQKTPISHRDELLMGELDRASKSDAEDRPTARVDEDPPKKPRRAEPAMPPPAVVAQIRELEAQLDRLIDEASRRDVSALAGDEDDEDEDEREDLEITRDALPPEMERPTPWNPPSGMAASPSSADTEVLPSAASLPRSLGSTATLGDVPPSRRSEAGDRAVFDTARELLSTDFYLRKWGRLAMRGRSEEVDDFGFDPIYDQKVRGVLEFLYTRYFRVEQTGIDRVPSRGRCLLVANHSGTLPLDGVMLKTAVKLEHPAGRDVRWLTEDFIYHMPYLGSTMNRLGAVRACQENAERLLAKEQLVAVFPEGVKGIGKLFAERYRLQRFGRGGFIKLCLRTQTPIVPVAVVGAEETNPMLFRIEYFAKALGVPYVPVTPTFPLLGPAGLLPAPTKWQMHFGEPIDFSSHGADAADDEILVGKLAERVRATIQGMLDRAVGSRKSVFFG